MTALDGYFIVDKPGGITSHDVVQVVRRKINMRRVGHAGTLDPLATGVLIVLIGPSTKLFDKFSIFDKEYEATLLLGTVTDSADIQGKILKESPFDHITKEQIEDVFKQFVGHIEQIPPMVSAVKVNGKRLYKLARKGIEVKREPRQIHISSIQLLEFNPPYAKFHLACSKGTYVRKLAEDAGGILGCGACISQIRRTRVGRFVITDSVNLENLNESHIQRWSA